MTKKKNTVKEVTVEKATETVDQGTSETQEVSKEETQAETLPEVKPDVSDKKAKSNKSKADVHPFRERANEVFARHNKTVKEVHITVDGTAFLQMQHARMHAESLKSDKIETLKREE
jgi:hypothetical protein